ncbi:hypothetical protein ACFV5N_12950 [Streptomyces sp. NPDC059853]|uniref:hypothetical protein n=1 Tax=Streptomyces sp. NPDC059853 TaxID=3346973 RepID=UPI00364897F7
MANASTADDRPTIGIVSENSADDGLALFTGIHFAQGQVGEYLTDTLAFSDPDGELADKSTPETLETVAEITDAPSPPEIPDSSRPSPRTSAAATCCRTPTPPTASSPRTSYADPRPRALDQRLRHRPHPDRPRTAGTLLFSSTATLFRPVATLGEYPRCEGLGSAGAFCLVPRGPFLRRPALDAPGHRTPGVPPLGNGTAHLGPLLIEISLAATLLIPQRYRWHLLIAGLSFHLCIATMMGLWSFALTMWGGLFLLCLPLGGSLHRPPRETPAPETTEEFPTPPLTSPATRP